MKWSKIPSRVSSRRIKTGPAFDGKSSRGCRERCTYRGKVGVITGGGSGHEPAFIGYTGKNLLDAVAVGELFSSPTAKSFYDAAREANGGKGVVCLYGNYAGDNMNVKMAIACCQGRN